MTYFDTPIVPIKTVVSNPFKKSFDGSSLDFNISTCPIRLKNSNYLYGSPDNEECMDKQAIVKLNDNNEVVDWWVVGKDYFVKSHRDFFQSIEEKILDRFDPNDIASFRIKTRSSRNGRWGLREYIFDDISVPVETTNNFQTTIKFRIVAWSGLDGLTANNYLLGAFDSFCMNGCVWAADGKADYTKMKKRNSKLFNLEHFSDKLVSASEEFYKRSEEFQKMAQTTLAVDEGLDFLDTLKISNKKKEGLKDLYIDEIDVRGTNVFTLHSALTNYASHQNPDKFITRKTKYFDDMEHELMFKREEEITNILQSSQWNELTERIAV